jgi:eukaryotic-like serine/threonine-protein kinase
MSYQIGDTVGDYQIIGILGAGGMGKVYKVKNQISDRVDALKILLPNLADDPELADRFIREIKVLARLNHPNIAGLRTAFRVENELLMVMEFVEGSSLDERCKKGRIPLEEAISYIQQALSALGYAHKQGVIHRDIKPANMMLTTDGVVKLMDFGIAKSKSDKKLTQTGTTMGSLFYMSAEQVQGNELDGRSDLYSIGVSLYEMVTGMRPFSGKSDFEIMIAQLQQAPQPPMQMMPDLPRALNDIIMKSLEKEPGKRFQTAEEFGAALASIGGALNHTPVQAVEGTTPTLTAPVGVGFATGMVSAQAPPPATMPQPVTAVGGTVPAAPGHTPTANMPTVMAPQPVQATAPPPPVPSAVVARPSTSKGYRGLYMTLGALIVVAILAVAALQVPRFLKTHASTDPAAQTAQNNTTTTTPASTTKGGGTQPAAGTSSTSTTPAGSANPNANQPPGVGNGAGNSVAPAGTAGVQGGAGLPATANAVIPGAGTASTPAKGSKIRNAATNAAGGGLNGAPSAVGGAGQVESNPAVGGGAQPAPPAANAQEIAELTDLHDKLAVRATTADQAVENLRKQMASTGNNLRGEISATQTRMHMNMDKFDKAMNAGDPVAARKAMKMAERDVEALEKFLNL